jgi:hypothetical protein
MSGRFIHASLLNVNNLNKTLSITLGSVVASLANAP